MSRRRWRWKKISKELHQGEVCEETRRKMHHPHALIPWVWLLLSPRWNVNSTEILIQLAKVADIDIPADVAAIVNIPRVKDLVNGLRLVNDTAERDISLLQKLHSRTKDEEQKQFLLKLVHPDRRVTKRTKTGMIEKFSKWLNDDELFGYTYVIWSLGYFYRRYLVTFTSLKV